MFVEYLSNKYSKTIKSSVTLISQKIIYFLQHENMCFATHKNDNKNNGNKNLEIISFVYWSILNFIFFCGLFCKISNWNNGVCNVWESIFSHDLLTFVVASCSVDKFPQVRSRSESGKYYFFLSSARDIFSSFALLDVLSFLLRCRSRKHFICSFYFRSLVSTTFWKIMSTFPWPEEKIEIKENKRRLGERTIILSYYLSDNIFQIEFDLCQIEASRRKSNWSDPFQNIGNWD